MREGVSTKLTKAFKSMYETVKACIRYKSEMSDFFDSYIGVKQCDPSSTLLFLLFINDILSNINTDIDGLFTLNEMKLFLLLFADDAILFAQKPEALQCMLNDLSTYCDTWKLRVNTNKTKVVIFEKGRHTSYDFYYGNTLLNIVDCFKYLGMYFYKNGNWLRSENQLVKHSHPAMHNLFIVFNPINLTVSDKCKLFDSLVGPVLHYAAEVWGYRACKNIETVHCKFLRKALCVKLSTNTDGLYGETGRYPMYIKRLFIVLRYWTKILTSRSNLTKIVYKMLRNDVENGNIYNEMNWAYQIKHILDNIGLSDIWIQQDTVTINFLVIKQRIIDIYKQTWYTRLCNSNRLSSYVMYKTEPKMENYLNNIYAEKYRIALRKFRLSSHDLTIETGRYTNVERDLRYCEHCNQNVIENEYHFLLVCPKYRHLRVKFFKPYFCRWPSLHKFRMLMYTESKNSSVSKYLYYAFRLRSN